MPVAWLTAVLGALGSHSRAPRRDSWPSRSPRQFALPLTQTDEVGHGGGMDEFYAAVEERSGLRDAPAAVGAVLRALAETADPPPSVGSRAAPDELRSLLNSGTLARG